MRTFFRTLVLLLAGILGVLRRLCMSFVEENSMRFFSCNHSEWNTLSVLLSNGTIC